MYSYHNVIVIADEFRHWDILKLLYYTTESLFTKVKGMREWGFLNNIQQMHKETCYYKKRTINYAQTTIMGYCVERERNRQCYVCFLVYLNLLSYCYLFIYLFELLN